MHVRTGERPTALLNENSGASHGQNAVPQANPSPMKRSGRERRRGAGGSAHSIGASSLTGEVLSSCRTNTTCPKKRPVEGHSYWFSSWGLPRPDETGPPREDAEADKPVFKRIASARENYLLPRHRGLSEPISTIGILQAGDGV